MPTSEYTPTTQDVAALARARTKNSTGKEVGNFIDDSAPDADDGTRPNGTEVTALIAMAVGRVASKVGEDLCEDDLKEQAKQAVVLRVAAQIELSYFPEQVGSGKSPYTQYRSEYDESMRELQDAVERECGGSDGEVGGSRLPSYHFPNQIAGFNQRW